MNQKPSEQPSETRWSITRNGVRTSRFLNGTATISMEELRRDWHNWPEFEQWDFAASIRPIEPTLRRQIVRFLVQNEPESVAVRTAVRSSLAPLVLKELPTDESLPLLDRWCRTTRGARGNILHALGSIGTDEARDSLQWCFDSLWKNNELCAEHYSDSNLIDCMEELLSLGDDPSRLRAAYMFLLNHDAEHIRRMCEVRLSKFFKA